jgi:hypothetical protein
MSSRLLTKCILSLFFLVSSSFALCNSQFNYNVIDGGIEVTGCVDVCPSDLTIPEEIDGYSVISIGERAFWRNQLTSVLIPHSVTSIGPQAFAENQFTSITIPDSLTSIGDEAFYGNQLTSVTIPESVNTYVGWAFDGNLGISSGGWKYFIVSGSAMIEGCTNTCSSDLIIPDTVDGYSVSSIGRSAFYGNQLSSVIIPDSVTRIGPTAF